MSPDKKFDLGDYVEVKDRIARFYDLFGQGRLVTHGYELTREPDDKPKVIVTAKAYRTPDDPLPGVGTSWMYLPGKTSYTAGSELENVETSAWGRAIGSLGILIDRSIASANEVDSKKGNDEAPPNILERIEAARPPRTDGGLIGTVEVGTSKDSDLELRQTPEGPAIGFRLKGDKGGIKVIARGDLADTLAMVKSELVGQRVTCWGRVSDETFTPKGTQKKVVYQVLALERIQAPEFTLPAPEAESVPMFDAEAELDAAALA